MEKQTSPNNLLPVVILLSVLVGGLGLLLWQNMQAAQNPAVTVSLQDGSVRVEGRGPEAAVTAIDHTQIREKKIAQALYAIHKAKEGTLNKEVLSDVQTMEAALLDLQSGKHSASAVNDSLKQSRANLNTISLEPSEKLPLMQNVDDAIAVTSWCMANP